MYVLDTSINFTRALEQDTAGGSSTTTIVVLDQTEKHKAKLAASQLELDARSFFSDKGRDSRSAGNLWDFLIQYS